jgi:hypothetical protein
MDSQAVIILSNDASRDLWVPFVSNFKKEWPQCPYTLYFVTNLESFNPEGFINIKTGLRLKWTSDWASSYRAALNQINEEFLLVLLDDFLIRNPDMKVIKQAFQELNSQNIDCIHLKNDPRIIIPEDKLVAIYPDDHPYQAHLAAFWRKKTLLQLLADGENPWDFEVQGSKRLGRIGVAAALRHDCFNYIGLVEKGEWVKNINQLINRHSLNLDLEARPKQSRYSLKPSLKRFWFNMVMNYVPYKLRIKLSDAVKRGLASY